MRAIVQHRYGGTEQLHLADVEVPEPGPGQARVRVAAAGVDRGTWHLMTGTPLLARLAFGLRGPRLRPGMDLAGTVEAVGPGVTEVAVGDEVMGIGTGAFAEQAVAPVAKLVPRPAALTTEQAAALPISGLTALQALRAARVPAGGSVLVLGASGGVGSYAVQLARHDGLRVTGVCSAAKRDAVAALGAEQVVAHDEPGTVERLRGLGPYDAVLDVGGALPLRVLRALLAPRGTLVVVGAEGGGALLGGLRRSLRAAALSPLVRQRLVMLVSAETSDDLAELARLAGAGHVVPRVQRTFPLAATGDAIDHLTAGGVVGKVVVLPQDQAG